MIGMGRNHDFAPGPHEVLLFLVQAERGPQTLQEPKGEQLVSIIGWTDSLADASRLMRQDRELLTNQNPATVRHAFWVEGVDENGRVVSETHAVAGTVRHYRIHKVEVKQ